MPGLSSCVSSRGLSSLSRGTGSALSLLLLLLLPLDLSTLPCREAPTLLADSMLLSRRVSPAQGEKASLLSRLAAVAQRYPKVKVRHFPLVKKHC